MARRGAAVLVDRDLELWSFFANGRMLDAEASNIRVCTAHPRHVVLGPVGKCIWGINEDKSIHAPWGVRR